MPAKTLDNFNSEGKTAEAAIAIGKIHGISSDVRQKGNSISKIHSKRKEKLNFDRYLVGRSYQLFKSAVKVQATLEFYGKC